MQLDSQEITTLDILDQLRGVPGVDSMPTGDETNAVSGSSEGGTDNRIPAYGNQSDAEEDKVTSKEELRVKIATLEAEVKSLGETISNTKVETTMLEKRIKDKDSFIQSLRELNEKQVQAESKRVQDLSNTYFEIKEIQTRLVGFFNNLEETPEEALTTLNEFSKVIEDNGKRTQNAVREQGKNKFASIQVQLGTSKKEHAYLESQILGNDNDDIKFMEFVRYDTAKLIPWIKDLLEKYRENEQANEQGVEIGVIRELNERKKEVEKLQRELREARAYQQATATAPKANTGKQTPKTGNTIPVKIIEDSSSLTPLQKMMRGDYK